MRLILLTAFLGVFLQPALAAEDGKAVIQRMIQKMRGHVNVATYEITIQRPAWTRTLKIKVWDDRKDKKVFVRILEPAKDQGTSFLRIGYNLWNYLPSVEKVMKIPPSMMLQPWMGSDFTNDDLVKESSYIDDYTHGVVGAEVVEGQKVTRIELTPLPHAPVVWGKVVFWVRADDVPVRQHFIDERGRLIKELLFKEVQTRDGVMLPTRWEMRPVLKEGQETVLRLVTIDFDPVPPIPDSVFTERQLREGF